MTERHIRFHVDGELGVLKRVAFLADPNLRGGLERTEAEIAAAPPGSIIFGGLTYTILITGPMADEINRIQYRGLGLCEAMKAEPGALTLRVSQPDRDSAMEVVQQLRATADVLQHMLSCARVE